ncbi:MAG: CYTH domain-containing protein [Alistipes sp.]|nr:CYTH domain-containing protein [Alistipes sp.]MBQ3248420.1 CYTH domain-containing protein [Alistipes sp.]
MAEEIERKFLVVGEYKHLAHSSSHLVQGYIASGRRTVRVRLSDDRAWLTIKGPSRDGGLSRYEWEREIDATEAMELLQLAEGALIDKRRWLVEYEGHIFEVDEFAGDNEGLTIAEVELSSTDEAFARPLWLGREVTGERRFYNSHLRAHPYSEWSAEERE